MAGRNMTVIAVKVAMGCRTFGLILQKVEENGYHYYLVL